MMTYNLWNFFLHTSIGIILFSLSQWYLGHYIKIISKYLFNSNNIKYLLITIIIFSIFLYHFKFNVNIHYCIDEEIEKKLTENALKNTSINNTVNVDRVTVNVPNNMLNSIGLATCILGGMKVGGTLVKGGSPWIKAGAAIGTATVAGVMHTICSTSNKSDINNILTNNNNKPYSAQSVLESGENNCFSIDDLITIFNSTLILKATIMYLIYTLIVFIVMTLISTNKPKFISNYLLNKSNKNFIINYIVTKLSTITYKINMMFSCLVLFTLIITYLFFSYFIAWFKYNFTYLCKMYLENHSSNITIHSNIFINTDINEYLDNEYMISIVSIFILLIIFHSLISNLVYNKKINIDNLKKYKCSKPLFIILNILFNDGSRFNIIFIFILMLCLFITSCYSCYLWYWLIQDFHYIAYSSINT